MMRRNRVAVTALLAIAVPALLLSWLLLTQSGMQTAAALLTRTLAGQLQLEGVSGQLSGRLQIGRLRWIGAGGAVDARNIALHWSPLALMRGALDVSTLRIAELTIATKDTGEAPRLPDTLALPVQLQIDELVIGPLHVNGQLIADGGSAALNSSNDAYVLKTLQMRRGELLLRAGGRLAMHAPYAVALDAALSGKVEAKPFSLVLSAGGDLQRSELDVRTQEAPFELTLQAVLHPFSATPLTAFSASAKNLDLSALLAELPRTRIAADCHMARTQSAGGKGQASNCRLDNTLAGPLDQGRLPVTRITAQLSQHEDKLLLSGLRLGIGAGSLQGRAEASAAGIRAELNAQVLDLAAIHGRARRSRLAGPLLFSSEAGGMMLRLDLREDKLSVQAQLLADGETLKLERLLLNARGASFEAAGHMRTATREFSLQGRFDHFDPAQFVHAPAGSLDGDFKASGRMDKTPQLDLSFALRDSRLANAPANGRGHVNLVWPQVRKADVQLDFGPNRVRLAGAFGGAGDRLRLDIDAPALAPYGMEGDLQAHLQAGGRLHAPTLDGQVRSVSLRLPGYGRIQKLNLDAEMGGSADAPLNLRVRFDRLDLASRSSAVRKFDLDLNGSRRQHQLQLTAQLDEDLPLRVAARGSFTGKDAADWHGTLTQLTLDQAGSQRYLHLLGEAPLAFGPEQWALGPALLQSRNAAIKLQASAAPGKLQATLAADNPSIGHVGLDIAAKPAHAWALTAQTPWQGKLQATIGDLAWVNDLLGSPWQASGSLKAEIRIAGTPQFPLLNGQVSGSRLGLRHLDTRMHLHNGSLLANIRDSILSLDEFSMQSVLTAPPSPLQRMLDDQGRALIATPGRISARGRMKLGGIGSADADELHLDVEVDRLGVAQTPRQWLLLSGQSQLHWQQGKLGVQARLGVDAAHWQLADLSRPQLSDDVIVRREGNASSEARRVTPWAGTVRIGLGRYFSFEGAGARGRLAGQVQISASAQDLPRASGTVNLLNGRYEAYGQQLDIERGILNFQGLLENPALNILALRKGLPVEAGVEISGFAQAPQIRLVSEPNVPDAEKLSWLVLGRPPTQEGSDTGVLMAAVGAIFGNQGGAASQRIKDSFGIDEISVRSGVPGQQQAMNSRVVSMSSSSASSGQVFAVGKQLSNRLRLSYEQAIGGVDSLVRLTFKVTDKVSVVGTSGTDAALDVFYTFSFGGKPAAPRVP